MAYRRYTDLHGMHGQTTESNRKSVMTENSGGCGSVGSSIASGGGCIMTHGEGGGGAKGSLKRKAVEPGRGVPG